MQVRVIEFVQGSYELVVAAESREQASKQSSVKLEEYIIVQEVSL
jgi:hypothetical protein